MIVVCDTNIFISACIRPTGAAHEVLGRWMDEAFELVISSPLLTELEDVSSRAKFASVLARAPSAVQDMLRALALRAEQVVPVDVTIVADDPDDDLILGTAIAGDANYIVTGDKHLLVLGTYGGIEILSPRQFLDLLNVSDLIS